MSKREKRFYSKLVKVFESEGREWIAIPKSTLNLSIRDYFDSLTHLSESDHENSIDDFFDTSDFHFYYTNSVLQIHNHRVNDTSVAIVCRYHETPSTV